LLAESTVVANLPANNKQKPAVLDDQGIDQLVIPDFLRKRADSDDLLPMVSRSLSQKKKAFYIIIGQWLSRMFYGQADHLKKPEKKAKKDLMQSVLWDMESIALPEKIDPNYSTNICARTSR
jgi:hypothetical protein